jgi:hypothetical protein
MLIVAVSAAFVSGLAVVAAVLPDPSEGPTPPGTRVAYYAVFAVSLIALASIPLVMSVVDRRAGGDPALAWRIELLAGAALAMLLLGWGVDTWAYPPHDLRQCFPEYRGNSTTIVVRRICESGRVNRPLGQRRLDDGLIAAVVALFVTGAAVARMALPPAPRAGGVADPS